jgi:hypothetical protein
MLLTPRGACDGNIVTAKPDSVIALATHVETLELELAEAQTNSTLKYVELSISIVGSGDGPYGGQGNT